MKNIIYKDKVVHYNPEDHPTVECPFVIVKFNPIGNNVTMVLGPHVKNVKLIGRNHD